MYTDIIEMNTYDESVKIVANPKNLLIEKIMKRKAITAHFLLFFFFLVSCEKTKEDFYLSVDKDFIEFPSEGGTCTISISSNTDWIITTPNNSIQLSATKGSGSSDIIIAMPKIEGTEVLDFRLSIKTSDGSIVLNVTIRQEGELRDGDYMRITNSPQLFFNGDAHSLDSIVIDSNLGWKITGPEWLEGHYDNKWIPLSRTIIGKGDGHVKLRTTIANDDEEDRKDTLKIIQPYAGDATENIQVFQTGKYKINIKNHYATFDSFVYDLVLGNMVNSYWYYLSNRELKKEDFTTENIGKWNHSNSTDNKFHEWRDLSESTNYYLYFAVATENNKLKINGKSLKTHKKGGNPMVSIESVKFENNCWYWTTIPDNDVVDYYVAAFPYSKNPEMFEWSDARLCYYMHTGKHIKKLYNTTKQLKYSNVSSDILIITQGAGRDLNWSGEITRYIGKVN